MSPRHHLDAATLVSHAAGALSPEMSAVVALHLAGCAECRASLARADAIGGVLVEQQHPAHAQGAQHARLRDAMLARLDEPAPQPAAPANADDEVTGQLRLPSVAVTVAPAMGVPFGSVTVPDSRPCESVMVTETAWLLPTWMGTVVVA